MSEIIYRIQDRQGKGPYKPGFSHKWAIEDKDTQLLPPWYFQFGNIHLKRKFKWFGCGCRSLDQLTKWFTEQEYKTLLKLNHECYKIEVDEVIAESDIQLVFSRKLPLNKKIEAVVLY